MYSAPVSFSNRYYNFGTTLGSAADQWGSYVSRLANEDITWETSEQWDLGFDARFFNSKLNMTFDWYYKTTKDWLSRLFSPPLEQVHLILMEAT